MHPTKQHLNITARYWLQLFAPASMRPTKQQSIMLAEPRDPWSDSFLSHAKFSCALSPTFQQEEAGCCLVEGERLGKVSEHRYKTRWAGANETRDSSINMRSICTENVRHKLKVTETKLKGLDLITSCWTGYAAFKTSDSHATFSY
jgi:hypothetical protein